MKLWRITFLMVFVALQLACQVTNAPVTPGVVVYQDLATTMPTFTQTILSPTSNTPKTSQSTPKPTHEALFTPKPSISPNLTSMVTPSQPVKETSHRYTYQTNLSDAEILAFHQAFQPNNGWEVEMTAKDPDGSGGIVRLMKDGRSLMLLISFNEYDHKNTISFEYPP